MRKFLDNRFVKFNSLSELLSYAEKYHTGKVSNSICWDINDTGTNNLAESLELARYGWKQGITQITAITDSLDITSRVHRPEIMFDVIGDGGYEMSRVVSGEPENAMHWQDSPDMHKSNNGPIVKICLSICVSAGINEQFIRIRGAAVCALIDAIEQTGRRVDVDIIGYGHSESSDGSYGPNGFVCKVKSPEYEPSRSVLSFVMSHPSMLRRIGHAIGEGLNGPRFDGWSPRFNPKLDDKAFWSELDGIPDVYMPGEDVSKGKFDGANAALTWVIAQLTKLGIELE